MPWGAVAGAVIGAVGSYAAASKSAKASERAADAQVQASQDANQTQLEMFNQNRADALPWRTAGQGALTQLSEGTAPGGDFARDFTLADFVKDPGYEFRRTEGMRGLEGSAAARGGLLNGGTLKALDRYNQDYASGEYSNAYNRFNNDRTQRFNRLSSIAGLGQTATRDVANLGTQTAQTIGANQIGAGNARASGYVGSANAINSGVQSLGNWWQSQQLLNSLNKQPTGYTSGGKTYTEDPASIGPFPD